MIFKKALCLSMAIGMLFTVGCGDKSKKSSNQEYGNTMIVNSEGLPFSILHKVALLMPARSATSAEGSCLRSRAILICSPICTRISLVSGIIAVVFLFMSSTSLM